jgi:hypothetical protein
VLSAQSAGTDLEEEAAAQLSSKVHGVRGGFALLLLQAATPLITVVVVALGV